MIEKHRSNNSREKHIKNLEQLVLRLFRRIEAIDPACKIAQQAKDYLSREGGMQSILRNDQETEDPTEHM